ncbi:ABC transporter permease [Cryobacterium sp. N19]|uniref:ABC transporter permease n=1 Tax=Cryobacterium sp. N19 TaxID=2048288 RepID=UPI0013048E0D|nr:ABC transporter permease [Cryobacterium sp. N19]
MLFMFATIMVIYVSMWLAFTVLGPTPSAVVTSAGAHVTNALDRAGVALVDAGTEGQNAEISVHDSRVYVLLDASNQPAWNPIWIGLRDAGFAADAITVVDSDGDVKLDPLRANLGVAAMLGIASIAFIGTTVPLVAMRERGLLRLFGTTPLRRSTFLLAQLPARVLVAAVPITLTVAIAVWQRYLDGLDVLGLGVTFLLGTAMLLSFGLLFAARSRNAEATQQSMVMLTIMLTFASGGLLPASIVPPVIQIAMNCLPTTWLATAASVTLTGSEPFFPLTALWALMAVAAGCAAGMAARLFEWDQSEPRRSKLAIRREKVQAQL